MDNLHYSIQYAGDCGEVFLILRCKETKDVLDISKNPYCADGELDDWLFGWNNHKRGNTYKSFNIKALEERIRSKLVCIQQK